VVAAKLLLIKSRALLPAPPVPDDDEEDVGEELARQLRAYRKLKELAQQLKAKEAEGHPTYLRLAPLPRLEKALDLSEVTLEQLLVAVQEALSLQPEAGPVSEVVAPIVISITDKIRDIEGMLAGRGSFSFNRLLQRAHSRGEIIVIFLAMLELIKAGRARAKQTTLFGEILISRPEIPSSQAAPGSP
jgi:segregation and condensation protein A